VASEFPGDVRFVEENYGDSPLASRFGLTRYPAIFVDDVLVATPNDFGFYGKGETEEGGRYAPLQSARSHDRFRSDLSRIVRLVLQGRGAEAKAEARPAAEVDLRALPEFSLFDLDGKPITREDLRGRVVLVDFWATWCPPCRSVLTWLSAVKQRYGDRLVVLTLAVESDPQSVRRAAAENGSPFVWALCDPKVAGAFGNLSALPTLWLFDGAGTTVGRYFGAAPGLHAGAESKIRALLP
jgi:thiol-disulfide isomerase/thioredoxin